MEFFKRNAGTVVGLVIIAGLVVITLVPVTVPKETRQQFYERCLKPQQQSFKRDLTCDQDSQKNRPHLTTQQG